MENHYLSEERLKELKEELENLRGPKRLEIADRLKQAKEFGDLSENSEYSEAREEQTRVETRIFELEELIKNAVLIKKETKEAVGVGSKVTVTKGDKTIVYNIVGSNEALPEEGKISNESPLGQAFMRHKVGDTVRVATPAGEVEYNIAKLE